MADAEKKDIGLLNSLEVGADEKVKMTAERGEVMKFVVPYVKEL